MLWNCFSLAAVEERVGAERGGADDESRTRGTLRRLPLDPAIQSAPPYLRRNRGFRLQGINAMVAKWPENGSGCCYQSPGRG
jgi:hypothetical protein